MPDMQQGMLPGSCVPLVGLRGGGKTAGGPSLSHTQNCRTAWHAHSRGHSQTHTSQGPALIAVRRQIFWPTGPPADEWLILRRRIHERLRGDTDINNRFMHMGRGEERLRCMDRVTWKLALPYVKKPTGTCCLSQETQTGALYQPRGVGWQGAERGVQKAGDIVYLWLIPVEV